LGALVSVGQLVRILDDHNEWAVGVETAVLLRSGDAYVVPRGVSHRLEPVDPSYLVMSHPARVVAIDRVVDPGLTADWDNRDRLPSRRT